MTTAATHFESLERTLNAAMDAAIATAPHGFTVLYEGNPGEPPASVDALWGRFVVNNGEAIQRELGRVGSRFAVPGMAVLQIFGPLDRGSAAILQIADAIANEFRAESLANGVVTMGQPTLRRIGRDGARLQYNLELPFRADPRNGLLAFGDVPATALANHYTLDTVTVEIQRTDGEVDTSRSDVVTLTVAGGASVGSLSGTVSAAAVAGVATFEGLTLSVTEPKGLRLSASASHWWSAQSSVIDVAMPQAVFAGVPGEGDAGVALDSFTVELVGPGGVVDTSRTDTVELSLAEGAPEDASLSGGVSVAAVDGVATFEGVVVDWGGDPEAGAFEVQLLAQAAGFESGVSDAVEIARLDPA